MLNNLIGNRHLILENLIKVIMAYDLAAPPNVGYQPNANLVLPLYVLTEVHEVHAQNGQIAYLRRPRPLSLIAGARVVLQCDPHLLCR